MLSLGTEVMVGPLDKEKQPDAVMFGRVKGYATIHSNGEMTPAYVVELNKEYQGYLSNKDAMNISFISLIVAHPDNVEGRII